MKPILLVLLLCSPASGAWPYDSVCQVSVRVGRGANGGSGCVIHHEGKYSYVLTVKHVATRTGAETACVWFPSTGREIISRGVVFSKHPQADLAIVKVGRVPLPAIPVAVLDPDDGPFVLVGYPGYDRYTLRWQQGNYVRHSDFTLYVDAAPEKGMSGGPAFNRYGRVVGSVAAYQSPYWGATPDTGLVTSNQAILELLRTPW